jgi:hypothetical protein
MDHLPRLVKSLNKEQVRYFKLFASRTQQSFERKDIQLFDFLRKNDEEQRGSIHAKTLSLRFKECVVSLKESIAE